jgi:alcohol dehydrogenase class IV
MNQFVFSTTKSILCEVGASRKIGELFTKIGCRSGDRILLVTDHGIRSRNLDQDCVQNLKSSGFEVIVYSDVIADPPEANILEAVEISKANNIRGVIGFGGGSSMDVAKLVAFLSSKDCQQPLSEIYGVGNCIGNRLPLIQVPTTAGTGSEVTPISIITTGASEKKGIVSPQLLPDWAVLDGELTLSLPVSITAATGIDAMVHAIEAYTTKLKKNPLSDLLAKEALRLLGANLRKVCSPSGSQDPHARGAMLLGSMYAGMAFANAPVGAVHALAYPIGTHFHVPHGLSNSLMLPYVVLTRPLNSLSLTPPSGMSSSSTPFVHQAMNSKLVLKCILN